jgi:hypothetical protein
LGRPVLSSVPLTVQLGSICAGSDAVPRNWETAVSHCASYGLRLPTVGEATTMALEYDVPGVGANDEQFWADDHNTATGRVATVNEIGVVHDGNALPGSRPSA